MAFGHILALTLAIISAPGFINAHQELYSGCSVDQTTFTEGDEIAIPADSAIASLEQCDAGCSTSLSSCTYFTWNHVSEDCKWFSGDFASAALINKRFSVTGVVGCTSEMTDGEKAPCSNLTLTVNYDICQPSALALECNIPNVKPFLDCTFCGEDLGEHCPVPYTLCEGEEHATANQDSVISLKVHCHGTCTDVAVVLEMTSGYYDRMGLMDDFTPGESCHTLHTNNDPADNCDVFDRYAHGGDTLDYTLSFKDDSFYAEITDYLYEDTDYDGTYDEVKYTIATGSGNAYAITCFASRGPEDLSDDYIRSGGLPNGAKIHQKSRSGKRAGAAVGQRRLPIKPNKKYSRKEKTNKGGN